VTASQARAQEGLLIYVPLRLLGLFLWGGALVYMIVPHWLAWGSLPLPTWLRGLGVALALSVIPLVIWAQRSLGDNVTKTVATKERHSLVTRGPYHWVRHPLYLFGSVFFVALGLIAANWTFFVAILLGAIPLAIRTRKEEAALIERFGDDYREYMKHTGRFFPKLIR
jgi:protein-S-isoprenylcysteine O-methyltransferase Ste14